MKILIPFLTVFMIVLVSGCSSVTVKTDYDRSVDFSKFKSYRWASGKQINPDDELAKRPLVKKRVKRAVDQVLEQKGYVKADSGSADFTVLVHAGVKEKMQVTDWGYHGWYGPWWGPYGGRVDVSTYEQGTLVIDIVDMSTKELAWRGMATGIVHDYDSQEDMEAAALVVSQKILKDFPPQKKKQD